MKGIISTLAILLIFLVVFALSSTFSTKTSELFDTTIKNLVLDRVYNKFISIEYALERILSEEARIGGINVTIEENQFVIVNFTEILPRIPSTSDFSKDLDKFEKFAETKLSETNLIVDLDFTDLKCLPIVISPYNISYTHLPATNCQQAPAQTQVAVDPQASWQYVNSYTFVFKPDGDIAGASVTGWSGPGCDKPTGLGLDITIIGNDITYGPNSTKTDYAKFCRFNIDNIACPAGLGFIHVIHNQNSDTDDKGVIDVQVHPNCNITSTISLNLTNIPSKTSVSLPSQTIKVKETLYQIERNDTIRIVGD